MQIEYDAEADALYIRFRDTKPAENVDVEDGLTIDLDEQRQIIGIELLDAHRRLPADSLTTVTLHNLLAPS